MKLFNGLYAPCSYCEALPEVRAALVNGCGTAGWKGAVVPDSMYGLCVTPACNIHDWMYTEGSCIADKVVADSLFSTNLNRLITAGSWWLRAARRLRAHTYVWFVEHEGYDAFWNGKEKPCTSTS